MTATSDAILWQWILLYTMFTPVHW